MPVRSMANGAQHDAQHRQKRDFLAGNTIASTEGPAREAKRSRLEDGDSDRHVVRSHPFGVKPAGNALVAQGSEDLAADLGMLTLLPHDLLLSILSLLDPADLARLERVNHSARAFARHEPLWRDIFLDQFKGRMRAWHGSWRGTVAGECGATASTSSSSSEPQTRIRPRQIFSDELYLQLQLASLPLQPYTPSTDSRRDQYRRIDRLDPQQTTKEDFLNSYAILNKPCLLLRDPSHGDELPSWSLEDMGKLLGSRRIRAEALAMSMDTYNAYARSCSPKIATEAHWIPDESPFYLFDATLARSLLKQNRFVVPRLLREDPNGNKGILTKEWDLFGLLQDQRPDNMWVIAGPARSGSGWHVDPNHTSAYNTVLSGTKLWLLLPPHITPPGVYISPDGSSITAPLSIAEWLRDFWKPCVRKHGRRGDDTLLVDVCGPGETIYVPAGWKHLVVNLDESVAFTQNFVSPAELPAVLDFLKNRPDQISGFRVKRSIDKKGASTESDGESEPELDALEDDGISEKSKLFDLFASRLELFDKALYEKGMSGLAHIEASRLKSKTASDESRGSSWWSSLKKSTDNRNKIKATQAVDGEPVAATESLFASQLDGDVLLDEVPW